MIADKTKSLLAEYLKTLISGGSHHGATISAGSGKIGLGGNNTSPAATTLDSEIAGITVSMVSDKTDENVIQVKLEVLGNAITGKVIREVGLFDSVPNMLQRFNFDGVGPFSSTERLQIYITMEIE